MSVPAFVVVFFEFIVHSSCDFIPVVGNSISFSGITVCGANVPHSLAARFGQAAFAADAFSVEILLTVGYAHVSDPGDFIHEEARIKVEEVVEGRRFSYLAYGVGDLVA